MKNDTKTVFVGSGRGYSARRNVGVATFEIEGLEEREDVRNSQYKSIYSRYANENACLNISGYWVPMWGDGHNLYPQEVQTLISENKLLPGVIQKRIDFLYGKGPCLLKEEIINGKLVRTPIVDKKIEAFLESWEERGFQNYREYLKNLIADYYHVKTACTQYHFTKGRKIGKLDSVYALSYVGSDEARLAANGDYQNKRIKQNDCQFVIVGDWVNIASRKFEVFNRFDPAAPLAHPSPIAFNSEKSMGKWVYAYNDWFLGLYDWIKASNLTPRYLNSYLKNALNAHVHVKIPQTWYMAQKTILQEICQHNLSSENKQASYRNVKLLNDQGEPYEYSEAMMEDLISYELDKITSMLSGEGKNQGKLYATTKVGDEGWEFVEFPGKFKEYFESVISYDKRADQVTLASVGISSSITNVENDGVISKSGSDVYYNYIIYLNTLVFPEYFVCKEINRAIAMNFPYVKEQGIKLGFQIEIPAKQQEVSPDDRLINKPPV